MPVLTVAHDVVCPWCWIAWHQAARLRTEFPTLELRWVGFELLPKGMEYHPPQPDPNAPNKPPIPSRFDLMQIAEGRPLPTRTRGISNSRLALEGAEFAYQAGKGDVYLDALYRAYWEEDRDISDMVVLKEIATKVVLDLSSFTEALEAHWYSDRVVEFDEPAHATGIWNVPTWEFPEQWVAETPYRTLHDMMARFVRETQ